MDASGGESVGESSPFHSAPASPAGSLARSTNQKSAPTYQPFPSFPPGPQTYAWDPTSLPPSASPLGRSSFSAQSLNSYHPSQDYRIPPYQPAFRVGNSHETPLEALQQYQANYGYSYPNHSLPPSNNDIAPPPVRPSSNYTPLGAHTAKSAPPDWRNPRINHVGASEQTGNWQERNRSAGESSTTLPPSWEYAATPVERSDALARGLVSAGQEAARWSWENQNGPTVRDNLWMGSSVPLPLTRPGGSHNGSHMGNYPIEGQSFMASRGAGSEVAGSDGTNGNDEIKMERKQRRKNGEPPRDLAQRRYACEICPDRSFARPSALNIHRVSLALSFRRAYFDVEILRSSLIRKKNVSPFSFDSAASSRVAQLRSD